MNKKMNRFRFITLIGSVLLFMACQPGMKEEKTADLAVDLMQDSLSLLPLWDTTLFLDNPHKGWYHHFYANSAGGYGQPGQDVGIIPGLKYLYLRLAWSFFEPEEGKYDWSLIDNVVDEYVPQGYKIALCITSKETHPTSTPDYSTVNNVSYATPHWVMKAGAEGNVVDNWGLKQWEPLYNDPVYLEKLEGFVKACAQKYDGKAFMESVDIGSIGEWGEGHTGFSSGLVPSPETVMKHIDIFLRHFKKTPIVLNDDYIYWEKNREESQKIRQYAEQHNLWLSEWSAMVKWWAEEGAAETYGIAHPDLFRSNYRKVPVTMEMHHYNDWVEWGLWCLPDGLDCNAFGLPFLARQILLTHATYISFQGWPDVFTSENPQALIYLGNLAGYWYFPKQLQIGQTGEEGLIVKINWYNKGASVAYYPYELSIKLENKDTGDGKVFFPQGSEVRDWIPQFETPETYIIDHQGLPSGEYTLSVKLEWSGEQEKVPVKLGLKDITLTDEGYYELTSFHLEKN